MNYATQNNIGDYQIARTGTTTAVTPAVGQVRRLDAKTQRRKPSSKRQAKIRADSDVTNGFLKCSFLPKLEKEQSIQACEKTERDFYQSLSKVAKKYNIEPIETKQFEFPYNITLALDDAQKQLKNKVKSWDRLYLGQSKRKAFLAVKEKFNTDTTLYYIPVVPIFLMLKDPKRKKNAQLLLSVCSYLYRVADIPYYRNEESYLYWHYEMYQEMIEQEYETDETEDCKSELRKSEQVGDSMEQKIINPVNLKMFEQRLSLFKTFDKFDHDCWNVACNAFALYKAYPKASVFRNAPVCESDPYDDQYDNQVIGIEKYISFCADTEGGLYESVRECINNEFNECVEMEEPTIYKAIDGSRITGNDFDFEKRLFDLLDELCGLLYQYKEELI